MAQLRPKEEYGGYLPLELPAGEEYFRFEDKDLRRYNCGRTAIYEAARASGIRRYHVPYYVCQTVVESLESAGAAVERYSVNAGLEPEGLQVGDPEKECVLLVDYFGLKDRFLRENAEKYPHMLLDCTQAFFCPPVLRRGVATVYSCRKFIGVPDGAYLVEQDTRARIAEPSSAWEHCSYLCRVYEEGTNAAYPDSLVNEQRLGIGRDGMSRLTERILRGANYEAIRQRRRANFLRLGEGLPDNRLTLPLEEEMVPQCYPYWAPAGTGLGLKKTLVEQKIYIPTLWKECRQLCPPDSLEVALTDDLLCLPVDQRYGLEDMDYLARTIQALLKEEKG